MKFRKQGEIMKKVFSLLQVLFLVVFASMAYAADKPIDKPGVLNEEAVMTSERLAKYDTLVIRDFSTKDVVYDRIDDEERPKVEAIKPLIVKNLTLSIEAEMKKRKLFKSVVVNSDVKENALILEGSFIEFNGGSRALRFWVGMGAGKTYLKAKGRLIDGQTGKELATFEDQETGYKGVASMESFESLFPHQAMSLGEHLGEFIQKLY